MPAPKRIQDDEVRQAIEEWGGNLTAAAAALCIAKENLRKRLVALGIDLETIRRRTLSKGSALSATLRLDRHPTKSSQPITMGGGNADGATKINAPATAIFHDAERTSSLSPVHSNTSAAMIDNEADDIPIKTAPRRHPPIRLKPEQRERIQQIVFRFQAAFGVATEENLVLEQFIDEQLVPWAESKLAGRRKAKGEE